MGKTKIVINQPYYFPQLHWWHRSLHADMTILLNNVNHNTNFPVNRAIVHDGIKKQFLTIPIKKKQKRWQINKIEVANHEWATNHINALKSYYKNTTFFKELEAVFETIDFVEKCNYLGTAIHNSIFSSLPWFNWQFEPIYPSNDTNNLVKNDRLIAICKLNNADILVLGMGSKNYVELEIEKYHDNGITIQYQDWKCPVENYSILHAIANYGWKKTVKLVSES